MTLIQGIILAIIQGLGEPIPISSSAQTQIAAFLMNIDTPGILFEAYLNIASFLAILWLTRKRVFKILQGFLLYLVRKNKEYVDDFKMAMFVLIGTLPAVFFGFTMKKVIDTYLSSINVVGFFLLITGIFLFFVRKIKGHKNEHEMTWKDALIIGLVQGTLSLIPGISRSGSTIVAALLVGLNRRTAFNYSFLLYLPISFGIMIVGVKDIFLDAFFRDNIAVNLVMFIVVFFTTMIGFQIFREVMKRGKLIYFSIYCWVVGLIMLFGF